MPPDPQRHNPDASDRCDPIAELFWFPNEQRLASGDTSPAVPRRSDRLQAILSWLWRFILEGFAACGVAMYPCFADPGELSDLLGVPRHAAAEPETASPPHPSPWQFEAPVRHFPAGARQPWHVPLVTSDREQAAAEPEEP